MRIGIVIGRIGGEDGVALETEKWMEVLQRRGHEIFILTGQLEAQVKGRVCLYEPLAFCHEDCVKDQDDAFLVQKCDEKVLMDKLEKNSDEIANRIEKWLDDENIDVLLTENSTVLPCHLTMGMALCKVMKKTAIKSIAHDHDFYWERGDRYKSKFTGIEEVLKTCFPPNFPNLKHAVINQACNTSLKKTMEMDSVVVPNVMDFKEPFGLLDDYNSDLRQAIGVEEDDILLFQITRIVARKCIENAIELIHRIEDPKVKLVITGTARDDVDGYMGVLQKMVKDLNLEERVLFAGESFDNARRMAKGRKIYSLSDAYAHARALTYFSSYEGFGNAFVEALVAKKPIFVNNYKPVYWPDIGSKGFKTVQIEDNKLTDEAVEAMKAIIYDEAKCKEIGEFNYKLGEEHFSYEVLDSILKDLFI